VNTASKKQATVGRTTAVREGIPELSDERFFQLIESRLSGLIALGHLFESHRNTEIRVTRPLLAMVLSRSSQLEELLDAFGAKNNEQWFTFREIMSASKIFATLGYKLLHIRHSQKTYRLLEINDDFSGDTRDALNFVRDSLREVMLCLVNHANRLGLNHSNNVIDPSVLNEVLPPGRLPDNRQIRHVESANDTVVHICTSFLELAAQSDLLYQPEQSKETDMTQLIPDPIGEESLRQIEYRFHSFQSLYDTYIWDTDTERMAPSLPILRGHISIIFHLLETATLLAHFHERHLASEHPFRKNLKSGCPIHDEQVLHTLFHFSIRYAGRYLESARQLCREVLRRFMDTKTIELPLPRYRGFHVRPSTLLARIVHHYGTDVSMKLLRSTYDVGSPLDLFRANEGINAVKRRRIADLTAALDLPESVTSSPSPVEFVRSVILRLAEQGTLVIYEQPLPIDLEHLQELQKQDLTTLEFVGEEIRRLLALGKIDLELDLAAEFTGDRRVLDDIRCLAENGYGEDRYGNDIPLPQQLSYIKRH
jgi:uncharacterized protein Usg